MIWKQNAAPLFIETINVLVHLVLAHTGSPVILVPGMGGSSIQGRVTDQSEVKPCEGILSNDYTTVYLNLSFINPGYINCLIEALKLQFDDQVLSKPAEGVETRVSGFGDPESVEWISPLLRIPATKYYYALVEELIKKGYKRGVSVFAAPYDFRKSPRELSSYFENLQTLTEKAYNANCKKRVVLVGHSMGGILINYFLNQQSSSWKETYIQSFVALAAPWGGSVAAVEAILYGKSFKIVPRGLVRTLSRTWPGTYFLLPTNNTISTTDALIVTPKRNYTIGDYGQLWLDLNITDGLRMWKMVQRILYELEAPGVDFHCLHSDNFNTTIRINFGETGFPDSPSKMEMGNGDGIVGLRSLQACNNWMNNQKLKHKTFRYLNLGGVVNHNEIVKNEIVINYIIGVTSQNTLDCTPKKHVIAF